MRRVSAGFGFVLGVLTSIPIIVITFFGQQQLGLPFPVFDLFDVMARILPGRFVTVSIDTIVKVITFFGLGDISRTAKLAEHGIAIVQFLILGGLVGLVLSLFGRRAAVIDSVTAGIGAGAILFGFFTGIYYKAGFPPAGVVASLFWLVFIFVGWSIIQAAMIKGVAVAASMPSDNPDRRRALYLGMSGLVAGIAVVSWIGYFLFGRGPRSQVDKTAETFIPEKTNGSAGSPSSQALANRIQPVPGTRQEVTPNQKFYRVDIDSLPPQVNVEKWRLEVNGDVNTPLSLTLKEIHDMPPVSQYITLSCISNPIGGDLISTTLLTGVQLKAVLARAGVQSEQIQGVKIDSADGFFETVSKADSQDPRTLLAYAMNQKPLPAAHGYPLRIYIPNRYGMKQPKWITRLTVLNNKDGGYWEQRGWSEQARPHIVSVIDVINKTDAGTVNMGGIAWAGDRGIQKVEVQVDEGDWEVAELRLPPLSPLTWVQWRYGWKGPGGRHQARVRAYDGTGTSQIMKSGGSFPNGATGVDQKSFTI